MATKWIRTNEKGIYRREDSEWLHARIMVNGRRTTRSLNTKNVRTATRMLPKLRRELKRDWAKKKEKPAQPASIDEVCILYEALTTIDSAKKNTQAMKRFLKRVGRDFGYPVTELTDRVVREWVRLIQASVKDLDRLEQAHKLRSAASELRQARAIFSRRMLPEYESLDLDRNQIRDFLEAPGPKAPPVQYEILPSAIAQRIADDYPELEAESPAAYAGFLLGIGCGLRNSEAARAEWTDLETDADDRTWLRVGLREHSTTKNQRTRWVPVPETVLEGLARVRPSELPTANYLLPAANYTLRYNAMTRVLARWLRSKGLDRKRWPKAYYELRKYCGSVEARDHRSILAAAQALGNLPTTAEKYYVDAMNGPAPVRILNETVEGYKSTTSIVKEQKYGSMGDH